MAPDILQYRIKTLNPESSLCPTQRYLDGLKYWHLTQNALSGSKIRNTLYP